MKKILQLTAMTLAGLGVVCLTGCASVSKSGSASMGIITEAPFGTTPDGTPVQIYTLRNSNGAEARIMTYGGVVQKLTMPDKNGKFADIVLGFDNLDGYVNPGYVKACPYFGALIGRYGNRIGGGKFTLEGKTYTLATNNGPNSLHGGIKGFDKVVWKAVKADIGPQGPRLELNYLSKDGEEGFPGNLNVMATYTLTDDNALRLDFTATTDQPTVCNLTHHSYFNLAGQGNGDILSHIVYINADNITPVDSNLITTGEIKPVDGTPFDFRKPTAIGARINDPDTVLQYGPGYDHNWVIDKPLGQFGLMARVYEPTSGRVMEVFSTEPGLQFYTGNFLDGSITGKDGKVYRRRNAFCMEPHHYPDSPNKPQFPTTELKPGETYNNTIVYKFSIQP
ncbi:MAG TPA: aldose epimerase family protein [Candidatus Limnocylindrales bacterium]|nr:aldose epimerase family protein [Candidatus Limnocylindrales bacterium]